MKILLGSAYSPRWSGHVARSEHGSLPILALYHLAAIARAEGHDVDVMDHCAHWHPAAQADHPFHETQGPLGSIDAKAESTADNVWQLQDRLHVARIVRRELAVGMEKQQGVTGGRGCSAV